MTPSTGAGVTAAELNSEQVMVATPRSRCRGGEGRVGGSPPLSLSPSSLSLPPFCAILYVKYVHLLLSLKFKVFKGLLSK